MKNPGAVCGAGIGRIAARQNVHARGMQATHAFDGAQQHPRRFGLAHVAHDADVDKFRQPALILMPGVHQNAGQRPHLKHGPPSFKAVHTGHAKVEHQQMGL